MEAHWSDQIVAVFDTLHAGLSGALDALSEDPMPGSQAEAELRSEDIQDHILTAFSQSSILFETAADHLSAFVRGITQPALTISPWTSVRGALEASAMCRWLLEADIDAEARAARTIQFRCEGLSQQLKFARVAGRPVDLARVEEHLVAVLCHAADHGLGVRRGPNGAPKCLSRPMPDTTTLVGRYFQQEAAYRLLSALTHAHPWALQQLSFGAVREDESHLLQKAIGIRSIAYLGQLGLSAIEGQLMDKCSLFGWPRDPLAELFANATVSFARVVKTVDGMSLRPA